AITKDNPLVSGVAWPESIDRMKGAVYMVSEPYGRGQVITFTDEPHFRLFWRGTLPLFMNAILYSPSFPRELPPARPPLPVRFTRLRRRGCGRRCRPASRNTPESP